jgi:hypothetical protein
VYQQHEQLRWGNRGGGRSSRAEACRGVGGRKQRERVWSRRRGLVDVVAQRDTTSPRFLASASTIEQWVWPELGIDRKTLLSTEPQVRDNAVMIPESPLKISQPEPQ